MGRPGTPLAVHTDADPVGGLGQDPGEEAQPVRRQCPPRTRNCKPRGGMSGLAFLLFRGRAASVVN